MPKKQVIAVVDDDELAREGTIDLVESMGFIAKAFDRAEDFLQSDYLRSSSCLIADVLMPGMTGIELHNRLVEAGNTTPTILITSFPNDRDRARARQAGTLSLALRSMSSAPAPFCSSTRRNRSSKARPALSWAGRPPPRPSAPPRWKRCRRRSCRPNSALRRRYCCRKRRRSTPSALRRHKHAASTAAPPCRCRLNRHPG